MINKYVGGYYGSELNKFIDENCSHEMTAMNIDLIMYKAYKKHIRIIESKHSNETMKTGQYKLLRLLANSIRPIGYKFEVLIIYGNPPYDFVKIVNLCNNMETEVNKIQLINYLNFENIELDWKIINNWSINNDNR